MNFMIYLNISSFWLVFFIQPPWSNLDTRIYIPHFYASYASTKHYIILCEFTLGLIIFNLKPNNPEVVKDTGLFKLNGLELGYVRNCTCTICPTWAIMPSIQNAIQILRCSSEDRYFCQMRYAFYSRAKRIP